MRLGSFMHPLCALALGLALLACGDEPSDGPAAETLSIEVMQASVDLVEASLTDAHPAAVDGLPTPVAAALDGVREQARAPLTEAQFAFALARAVATLGDAHTRIERAPEALAAVEVVDLPLVWSTAGVFVTRDTAQLERGDRIDALGGLDPDALLDGLAGLVAHENRHHLRGTAPETLPRVDVLRALGALDDGPLEIVVQRDGEALTLALPAAPPGEPAAPDRPWVGYAFDDEASFGHFWLDDCRYDAEFAGALDAFMAEAVERGVQDVAVDLTRNPGGDSTVAFAFLAYVEQPYAAFGVDLRVSEQMFAAYPIFDSPEVRGALEAFGVDLSGPVWSIPGAAIAASITAGLPPVPEERRFAGAVHGLVSARTFSSASLFATLLRDNGTGLLVGEPTGNAVDFHGQGITRPIPDAGLVLHVATSRNLRPDRARADASTLEPDLLAPMTAEHLRAGTDPALAALRGHLRRM